MTDATHAQLDGWLRPGPNAGEGSAGTAARGKAPGNVPRSDRPRRAIPLFPGGELALALLCEISPVQYANSPPRRTSTPPKSSPPREHVMTANTTANEGM